MLSLFRSNESVKSNSINYREDSGRQARGLSLLDRAINAAIREQNKSQKSDSVYEDQNLDNQHFDVIEEVVSESLSHEAAQNAVVSSDHSVAPPGELSGSDHELVCEGNIYELILTSCVKQKRK